MAMLKYGSAIIAEPCITPDKWQKAVCCGHKAKCVCGEKGCRVKVAKTIIAKYDPQKYLLSHCSIMAAVDTELADSKNLKSNYYIHPVYSKFVNNNGDAWTKTVLANSYKTFIGSNNFLEHIQVPALSKGKVIDAVLREVPIGKNKEGKELTTYYVDILVATERKHEDLVRRIEAGKLQTLSMGCFSPGTEITLADGTKRNIEEIRPGDMVITHKGHVKSVMHVQKRWHEDIIYAIQIGGDQKTTYVTSEHPFWAFNKKHLCACGCGEKINIRLRGDRVENNIPIYSRFKLGHYARIINPNKNMYSLDQYRLLKDTNPTQEKMSLSWINAEDLEIKDLISYPISKVVIESENATIEKARLIGYFLAEGSFVKEVIVEGQENDYGIRCKICGNIYNKIGTHLPIHKISSKEYRELYPVAPLNAKINRNLIRTESRNDDLNIDGLKRTRKKIGVEFSLGGHEKDTLNKEISELAKKVFPQATILQYEKCIKIMGIDVAVFFDKYCGEYFNNKILPQEVLYWDKTVQRHLIATWIIGDLNTTGSKNLASQLRFILNRLGIIHGIYKTEARTYQTIIKKMTANGTIVSHSYEGIRSEAYMVQINYTGFDKLENELNYAFKFRIPLKYNNVSDTGKNIARKYWKNSHNLDSMLYPIKNIEKISYQGWVYNFSVKDDESYIANDIAVHNCRVAFTLCTKCGKKAADETEACEHVKYEKNNVFYDNDGVQRKVAELCGSADELDSVTFIDASWVENPAFTGAVVRNIVSPSEDIMAKIEEANKKEDYVIKDGDYLKAAKAAQKDPKEETLPEDPKEKAPSEEPAEEAVTEEPVTEEPPVPEEKPNKIQEMKDKIKQKILKELGDELLQDINGPENTGPRELETLDESLIQPTAALKNLWKVKTSWNRVFKDIVGKINKEGFDKLRFGAYMLLTSNDLTILSKYGYNRRDFLAVMSVLDNFFKNSMALDIKKALASIESTKDVDPIYALNKLAGRRLGEDEMKKALIWLKSMEAYKN